MNPKIKKLSYHGGAPVWFDSPHRPAYRITGTGFGDKPGKVQVERAGEMTSRPIVSWSDSVIYIDAATPLGGSYVEVIVTRPDGQRSAAFEYARPGNPYDGYTPPLEVAEVFMLAA